MKKTILAVAGIAGVAVLWASALYIIYGDIVQTHIRDKNPFPFYNGDNHLISHGGGAIDGLVYTNSKEAIESSIKSGMKFIEIDLIKTSDGMYIAGHDWKMVNQMTGHNGDKPLSSAEFKNSKIYGKYTPLDESEIAELLKRYPNWIMVIDKARDVEHLAKAFPFPDRIIIQVYGLHGYFDALKAGFKYPTLRLKGGRRGIKEIYKLFMKWLNIKSVILGEKSFNKNLDYIGKLHDDGVAVILYGHPSFKIVENADEVKKYTGKYIDLVDTDTLKSL